MAVLQSEIIFGFSVSYTVGKRCVYFIKLKLIKFKLSWDIFSTCQVSFSSGFTFFLEQLVRTTKNFKKYVVRVRGGDSLPQRITIMIWISVCPKAHTQKTWCYGKVVESVGGRVWWKEATSRVGGGCP